MFDLSVAADLLVFFAGAALLVVAARALGRDLLSWRVAAGYLGLTCAFFAAPLATTAHQVPTDIAFQFLPWSKSAELEGRRVRPENPLLSDVVLQMLPFRTLVRERWLAGEAPLWAHELGTGQPLLGNAQSAPLAPFHLLTLPLPPLRAMTVAAAWQVLTALLLMHLLVCALGGEPWGAAIAAIAYAFSTFAVSWLYYPLGMTAAWLPGVLAALVLLRNELREEGDGSRPARRAVIGLVCCTTAMALSGHPETLAHGALLAGCVVPALAWSLAESQHRRRFVTQALLAAFLAFCLAAPALLPVLEALPESERSMLLAGHPDGVAPPAFAARHLLTLANPLAFGSAREGNYAGPTNFQEHASAYGGLLALALGLAAAAAFRGRALLLVAGGAVALAGGLGLPPVFDLLRALPLIGDGAHGRLRLLWVLALAVVAGLHLDRLAGERKGRIAAGVALVLAGLVVALTVPPAPRGAGFDFQRLWWLLALAGLGAGLATLLVLRARRFWPQVAVVALVVDLFTLGARYNPTLPAHPALGSPPPLPVVLGRAAAAAERGEARRVIAEGWELLPNLAAYTGLWDARGNDPMRPAEAALLLNRRLHPKAGVAAPTLQGKSYDLALHRYLGIGFVLTPNFRKLPPPWEPLARGSGTQAWVNPAALPLFFFPARMRETTSLPGARQSFWRNQDFAAEGTWERNRDLPAPPPEQSGTVTLERLTANGFELRVSSPSGGIAVSSVAFARAWRARLDGREIPAARVNGGFLGFSSPPGEHTVRLEYRPAAWMLGWGLTALGTMGTAGVALISRSRPARRGRTRAAPR